MSAYEILKSYQVKWDGYSTYEPSKIYMLQNSIAENKKQKQILIKIKLNKKYKKI